MNRQQVVAALLVVSVVSGCFTTVDPLVTTPEAAKAGPRLKPNLMLLIDNSGSMWDPVPSGDSRSDALKAALQHVLTVEGASARYGLAVFPENGAATQSIRVDLPAASTSDDNAVLEAKALEVNDAIQVLVPSGGTPTAGSVSFVGATPGLNAADQRADYIVVITDGVPNLNAQNPNALCDCGSSGACSQERIDACSCTQNPASCLQTAGNLCSLGCLDEAQTLTAMQSLLGANVTTFVVSYGDDLAGAKEKAVMNSMASSGGSGTAYSVSGQADLEAALLDIIARVTPDADGGT